MMEGIHIVNPKRLKEKLSKFKSNNFHIVADFDSTLTQGIVNGKKLHSCYAYIREGRYISPKYQEKAFDYFKKYYPIESSPLFSLEEKTKKMEEWWTKHYNLMVEMGFDKKIINEIIPKIRLRKKSAEFFELLDKNNIPLLILSAGIGNFIEEILKLNNKLTKNIHIISNFLVFDKEDKAVSYTRPLIHTFNKNEVEVKKFPYQKEIIDKKNVILLGDMLGDLNMCSGIDHDNIIKIGFLNHDVEKLFDEFSKGFDVIILNDGSMDQVNKMLKEIL